MSSDYARCVEAFLDHLLVQKNYSRFTVQAYATDLRQLMTYLESEVPDFSSHGWRSVTFEDLLGFQQFLVSAGYADASISRKLASVRTFFQHLMLEGMISHDPSQGLEGPKVKRPLPRAISQEEVDRLLAAPAQVEGPTGLRDQAILELLYATGMRAGELAALEVNDVDLERNVVRCRGKGNKEREIPIHEIAAQKLLAYLQEGRPKLANGKKPSSALFLNYRGQPLSRQGIWLILSLIHI